MNQAAKQWMGLATALAIGGGCGWFAHQYVSRGAISQGQLPAGTVAPILEANHAVVDTDLAVVQKPAPVASNFIAVAVKQVGPAVVRIDAVRSFSPINPDTFKNPFFAISLVIKIPLTRGQNRLNRALVQGLLSAPVAIS
jgi:hypothetical protein